MRAAVSGIASLRERLRDGLAKSPIAYRLARGAGWALIGGLGARAFTVVTGVLVARIIGREGFGAFGMVQSTIGMFGVLAGFGMGSTATKYIAELRATDSTRAGNISNLTIGVSLSSSCLLAIACLLLSPWLAAETLRDPGMTDLLRAASLLLFFSTMNGVLIGVLSGFESFSRIARINLLQGAAAPLTAVPLAWQYQVDGVIASATVNACVGCILCAVVLRREYADWKFSPRFGRSALGEWIVLRDYSLPAVMAGLLVAPVTWVTNLILVRQPGGIGELGLFNAANQWRTFILILPGMLATAVLPVLSETHARSDRSDFTRTVRLCFRVTWLICLPITVLVIVAGKPLAMLFGKSFGGAEPLIALLMAACFFAVVSNSVAPALAGSGKMWFGTLLNLFWATMLLVGAWLLVPAYGAAGLAAAYLLAYILHLSWTMLYVEMRLAPSAVRSRWKLIGVSFLLLGLATHSVLARIRSVPYSIALLTLSVLPALHAVRLELSVRASARCGTQETR